MTADIITDLEIVLQKLEGIAPLVQKVSERAHSRILMSRFELFDAIQILKLQPEHERETP